MDITAKSLGRLTISSPHKFWYARVYRTSQNRPPRIVVHPSRAVGFGLCSSNYHDAIQSAQKERLMKCRACGRQLHHHMRGIPYIAPRITDLVSSLKNTLHLPQTTWQVTIINIQKSNVREDKPIVKWPESLQGNRGIRLRAPTTGQFSSIIHFLSWLNRIERLMNVGHVIFDCTITCEALPNYDTYSSSVSS